MATRGLTEYSGSAQTPGSSDAGTVSARPAPADTSANTSLDQVIASGTLKLEGLKQVESRLHSSDTGYAVAGARCRRSREGAGAEWKHEWRRKGCLIVKSQGLGGPRGVTVEGVTTGPLGKERCGDEFEISRLRRTIISNYRALTAPCHADNEISEPCKTQSGTSATATTLKYERRCLATALSLHQLHY
ncbi:hypothetical protein BD779DRAFT_1477914 [Infundibulicybe gibba]|nr:hypothetical protein BD779DRAFT_1477914 [Infundibulicybe gibba]